MECLKMFETTNQLSIIYHLEVLNYVGNRQAEKNSVETLDFKTTKFIYTQSAVRNKGVSHGYSQRSKRWLYQKQFNLLQPGNPT
jgi:hypothetical protein